MFEDSSQYLNQNQDGDIENSNMLLQLKIKRRNIQHIENILRNRMSFLVEQEKRL